MLAFSETKLNLKQNTFIALRLTIQCVRRRLFEHVDADFTQKTFDTVES